MITLQRIILYVSLLFFATNAFAMKGMDSSGHGMSAGKMSHSSTMSGSATKNDNFMHTGMTDGIHTNFQIMSLASMKMKAPDGKTHHIMVSFSQDDQKMNEVVGTMSVISPTGKKQTGELKNFGGGMYASNFNFDEAGEWNIVCRFKDQSTKHAVNFKYQHHKM